MSEDQVNLKDEKRGCTLGQERARQMLMKLPPSQRERALAAMDHWDSLSEEEQLAWRRSLKEALGEEL